MKIISHSGVIIDIAIMIGILIRSKIIIYRGERSPKYQIKKYKVFQNKFAKL